MLLNEIETGGSAITSYNAQWDAGTNGAVWSNLVGYSSNYLDFGYIVSHSVVAGQTYKIRVRASNFWGWSVFSQTISIKASSVPNKVTAPSTSIDTATGGILVSWQQPNSNANPITQYLVEAKLASELWAKICDSTPTVVATMQCVTSMPLYWDAATYNKQLGELVQFRVSAFNLNGWGPASDPNTIGATVRTVPTFMNTA